LNHFYKPEKNSAFLLRQDGEVEDFSIFTTSLEQIFIRLVKEQMKKEIY